MVSGPEVIDYLDRFSIDKAVVFGFPWENHALIRENNDEVWEFHENFPDRIIPFAVLSPLGGEQARMEAQRIIGMGFGGIGELGVYHGGWTASRFEAFSSVLVLAGEAHVPVLIHVNEQVGHHYPGKIPVDFHGLLQMIEAHPNVDFILAHWGGGVFFGALMPEIRRILSRTYLDTAASPFLYAPDIFTIGCSIMGSDKILFGSDFPLLGMDRYLKDIDRAGLDESARQAILGGNAERLLFGKAHRDCCADEES